MAAEGDEGWPGRTGWALSGSEKDAEREEPDDVAMDGRRALVDVFSASSLVDVVGLGVSGAVWVFAPLYWSSGVCFEPRLSW